MPMQRPHLFIEPRGPQHNFSPRQRGGDVSNPARVPNRAHNARRIVGEVTDLIAAVDALRDPIIDRSRLPMTVRSTTGWGVSASIPGRRNEMLSVVGFGQVARANVALDPDTLVKIEQAAQKYTDHREGRRKPNHFNFFEAQPAISLTSVEDLWASSLPIPVEFESAAWEIWLPPPAEPRLKEALDVLGLRARRSVSFERIRVLVLEANRLEVERLALCGAISQLRPASSLNSELIEVPAGVQVAAVQAAAARITAGPADAPAVCILDTGIRADHPLLRDSTDFARAVPGGTTGDWSGHGTRMAGLALYEDIGSLIGTRTRITLSTRIESVMIDPPPGAVGAAPLPAERLRQGVEAAEQENVGRQRTFCLVARFN